MVARKWEEIAGELGGRMGGSGFWERIARMGRQRILGADCADERQRILGADCADELALDSGIACLQVGGDGLILVDGAVFGIPIEQLPVPADAVLLKVGSSSSL
jgi:hypothetical protein